MHREGRRFASIEYVYDVGTAAGQVYIWAGLLSYGQNLAYPIAREQMCQISRIQADVARPRSKLSASDRAPTHPDFPGGSLVSSGSSLSCRPAPPPRRGPNETHMLPNVGMRQFTVIPLWVTSTAEMTSFQINILTTNLTVRFMLLFAYRNARPKSGERTYRTLRVGKEEPHNLRVRSALTALCE